MDNLVLTLLVLGLLLTSLESFFTVFDMKGRRRGSFRKTEGNPITRKIGLLPATAVSWLCVIVLTLMAGSAATVEVYNLTIMFMVTLVSIWGFALVWNISN